MLESPKETTETKRRETKYFAELKKSMTSEMCNSIKQEKLKQNKQTNNKTNPKQNVISKHGHTVKENLA